MHSAFFRDQQARKLPLLPQQAEVEEVEVEVNVIGGSQMEEARMGKRQRARKHQLMVLVVARERARQQVFPLDSSL